ncbi:hypothetical protein KAW65_09050 [candidate division WOR-3 bacterium]|nr:hypothetical protein [candidate division WOR-3 bacterium]
MGKSPLGERIHYIRKMILALTQGEFGKLLITRKTPEGVAQDVISTWERDVSEPSAEALTKLAELGRVSLNWLVAGKGKRPEGFRERTEIREYEPEANIPILAEVPAGFPEEIPEENVISWAVLPRSIVRKREGRLYGIFVKGNCMYPALKSGDEVIFDIGLQPENGDIVVARIEDAYEVRRFFKKRQAVELRPDNEVGYKPIIVAAKDEVCIEIIGVVIRSARDYRK